ncbi:preprotein translocase subunit YajC [Kamptonema cortianum]|nr:preprotein translocase subunit YajC [Kamptonema cortianum]MDL5046179.1 preprotein translocase subunit YajC [Oscillatoria amoena NRMC-F 0135]
MQLFITDLFIAMASPAQPGTEQSAPGWMQFMPLILMVVIFYFLLIRPQMKKQKEIDRMQKEIKSGDRIVTSGGIYATVTNVKDDVLTVKIADNVKINIQRSAVGVVLKEKESDSEKKD